jgi:hypothetical protein
MDPFAAAEQFWPHPKTSSRVLYWLLGSRSGTQEQYSPLCCSTVMSPMDRRKISPPFQGRRLSQAKNQHKQGTSWTLDYTALQPTLYWLDISLESESLSIAERVG